MSESRAVVEVVDTTPTRTLDELAVVANAEHQAVVEHLEAALSHAISCGEALLEAQALTPPGQWTSWVKEHLSIAVNTVSRYMRIAEYQDLVGDAKSMRVAERALAALGPGGIRVGPKADRKEMKANVRRLRSQGMTYQKIAELFDVSISTVHVYADDETLRRTLETKARKKRETRRAHQALAREQRDAAVKKAGGKQAEAYSLFRRSALLLDGALVESEDAEERSALRSALSYAHKAEDEIVRALRIGRETQHG